MSEHLARIAMMSASLPPTTGKWWSPDDEERVFPRVGGTGSISTFHEPNDDDERRDRRVTLGFAPPKAVPSPKEWGEAIWTARDIL